MSETIAAPWATKGLWPGGGEDRTLFDGSVAFPAMVLRERALARNIRSLADFCTRHDLSFAPHGKTTMSPQLFARQLAAGAWGITVAMGHQARVARGFGVSRILIANEVLDPATLRWIADEAAGGAGEILFLVDSDEGIAAAAREGVRAGVELPVLVDIGHAGGRTGVRHPDEAARLAHIVHDIEGVRLAGVSSYEGGLRSVAEVTDYFDGVRAITRRLRLEGVLPERPIVTAGGSAYFDRVAVELGEALAGDAQVILRSGAYVSHDDGVYVGKTAFNRIPDEGRLDAALEIWAHVVSVPEPGLAIIGMGKRDAPYDEGMPVPLRQRTADGVVSEIADRAAVTKLDDQHAYLSCEDGFAPRPGDLVCFGISHPCTAFDKWRRVPVADDHDRITEIIDTYF
ncbi:alanine racemase [Microbacterium sp.]|uniref:alanine racemase n=1 Tax=Microbacterium sp. TaxID=51671 RepID=UPI003F97C30D